MQNRRLNFALITINSRHSFNRSFSKDYMKARNAVSLRDWLVQFFTDGGARSLGEETCVEANSIVRRSVLISTKGI